MYLVVTSGWEGSHDRGGVPKVPPISVIYAPKAPKNPSVSIKFTF